MDLGNKIMKDIKTSSKKDIMKNLIYLSYDNILMISYLCLKNEKKRISKYF